MPSIDEILELKHQNDILSRKEIKEGKVILDSYPVNIQIGCTDLCNYECIMCRKRNDWALPEKTGLSIIEFLPYIKTLWWQGGEVFLYKNFNTIFDKANENYVKQTIITNGSLLNEEIIEKIIKNNVNLLMSIDATTKQLYEHIRRNGSFENIIEKLNIIDRIRKKYPDSAFTLQMQVVIMKCNYKYVLDILDFAKKYNFHAVNYHPIAEDTENTDEQIFFNKFKDIEIMKHITEQMKVVHKKAAEYNIQLEDTIPKIEMYSPNINMTENAIDNNNGPEKQVNKPDGKLICYAPWREMFIDHDVLKPTCICKSEQFIKFDEYTLRELWNHEVFVKHRESILNNAINFGCSKQCLDGGFFRL